MLDTIKLGSLYFDGQPQEAGYEYNDGQITFGPAVPGKELQWVKASGLLIAGRCVCTDISWEKLHAQGLVFGTTVQIDGQLYLCRCLKVGAERGAPNEWDAALDETDESNDLWHWEDTFFWGQETPENRVPYRVVRGWVSARFWSYDNATNRRVNVGFRPVLEPLCSELCFPDTLIGKTIRLYGSRGAPLEGCLLDVDDYDFTLAPAAGTPTDCSCISKVGDNLVVSRDSVLWAKEA